MILRGLEFVVTDNFGSPVTLRGDWDVAIPEGMDEDGVLALVNDRIAYAPMKALPMVSGVIADEGWRIEPAESPSSGAFSGDVSTDDEGVTVTDADGNPAEGNSAIFAVTTTSNSFEADRAENASAGRGFHAGDKIFIRSALLGGCGDCTIHIDAVKLAAEECGYNGKPGSILRFE